MATPDPQDSEREESEESESRAHRAETRRRQGLRQLVGYPGWEHLLEALKRSRYTRPSATPNPGA